jgi:hypothetical protein
MTHTPGNKTSYSDAFKKGVNDPSDRRFDHDGPEMMKAVRGLVRLPRDAVDRVLR